MKKKYCEKMMRKKGKDCCYQYLSVPCTVKKRRSENTKMAININKKEKKNIENEDKKCK